MACKASPIAVEVGDLFLPPLSEQIQNKSSLNISSLHLVLKWQAQLQRTVLSSVITWCAERWLQDIRESHRFHAACRKQKSTLEFGFLNTMIEDSSS